jgi:hypothetical protein
MENSLAEAKAHAFPPPFFFGYEKPWDKGETADLTL